MGYPDTTKAPEKGGEEAEQMGTWDTSLYGGDLPLDIKDEYYEQLYEGHTPEEAAALVWKELQLSEEDLPVFRLILADIQWKLGQMTEDTLRNALEMILAIYKSQKTGLPVKLPLTDFASTDMAGEF